MTLRLAQQPDYRVCPNCNGLGRVPCPKTFRPNKPPAPEPSSGHPIPCPVCNGSKIVLA